VHVNYCEVTYLFMSEKRGLGGFMCRRTPPPLFLCRLNEILRLLQTFIPPISTFRHDSVLHTNAARGAARAAVLELLFAGVGSALAVEG
jgi:hypothetical protein